MCDVVFVLVHSSRMVADDWLLCGWIGPKTGEFLLESLPRKADFPYSSSNRHR